MKTGFSATVTPASHTAAMKSINASNQQSLGSPLEKAGTFFKLFSGTLAEEQRSTGIPQGELSEALEILQSFPMDELTADEQEIVNGAIQLLIMQQDQLKAQVQGTGQGMTAKPAAGAEIQKAVLAILDKTIQQLQQIGTAITEGVEENMGMLQAQGRETSIHEERTEGVFKQLTDFIQRLTAEQQLTEQRNPSQRHAVVKEAPNPLPVTDSITQEPLQDHEPPVEMERPEPLAREIRQLETGRSTEGSQPLAGTSGENVKGGAAPQRPAQSAAPLPVIRAAYLTEDLAPVLQSSIRLTGNGESTQLKVNISPEHLGHLDIRLIASDGKIAAQIFTSSLAAKEVLDFQMNQLRHSLLQQGLTVETIDVSHQEPHEFAGQQHQQSDQRSFRQQKSGVIQRGQQGYEQVENEPVRPAYPTDGLMKVDYTI